jgi:GNAT superfamily N-acetyltransferase
MAPEAAVVSENLREAMRFFGRARSDGEVRDLSALTVISSGVDYGVFNAAVLCTALNGDVSTLSRQMDQSADFYRKKHLPWSFWACDDLIGEARTPLRNVLDRHSLRHITTAPGMVTEALAPACRVLPNMQVREVTDAATRSAFSHVTAIAFDIPFAVCDAVYSGGRGWGGSLRGWVGYLDGAPVSTTATITWAEVIGIYSVGTLPAYQRRGCAEAVMRHAVAQASAAARSNGVVLQSTRAGMRLYERMGFRAVTSFHVFLSR